MKMLVLTPLGQENLFANEELAKLFAQDKYFLDCVGFEDFLVKTGKVKNEEEAIIRTMLAVKTIFNQTSNKELLVVLGNAPKDCKFDMIIQFDNGVERITNEYDSMLKHISVKYANSKEISTYTKDYYKPEDCESSLKIADLVAKFIRKVLGTDEIQQGTTSVNK